MAVDDEVDVVDIAGIDVIVPRRARGMRGRLSPRVSLARGLGPLLVRELVAQLGLPYARERRRLTIGDAVDGAVTWEADAGHPVHLLGGLRPDLVVPSELRSGITVVAEGETRRGAYSVVDLDTPLEKLLRRVASSEAVISTSQLAVLASEGLGVPARVIETTLDDALALEPVHAVDAWDPHPVLEAFPAELWGRAADPTLLAAIGWRSRLAFLDSRGRG